MPVPPAGLADARERGMCLVSTGRTNRLQFLLRLQHHEPTTKLRNLTIKASDQAL
jgi:hypothetical protein